MLGRSALLTSLLLFSVSGGAVPCADLHNVQDRLTIDHSLRHKLHRYRGEHSETSDDPVKKFTFQEFRQFQVFLRGGRFIGRSGQAITTHPPFVDFRYLAKNAMTPNHVPMTESLGGWLDPASVISHNLTIDSRGRIFIFPDRFGPLRIQHSSAFGSLIFAGEIAVERGRVKKISNGSGHFQNERADLIKVVKVLRSMGVEVADDAIEFVLVSR